MQDRVQNVQDPYDLKAKEKNMTEVRTVSIPGG